MTDAPIGPLAIIELTNLKAADKLEELAMHPSLAMKPEWIKELAQNKASWVRQALAENPAIPARTASTQQWQTQPVTTEELTL